jgi:chorismate mutase
MSEGDNVEDLLELIQETTSEVIELLGERATIQKRIAEAKGRLKARGIKMADFNIALRLKQLEAEDRNASLTNLKVCFQALELGGQGDLFVGGDG